MSPVASNIAALRTELERRATRAREAIVKSLHEVGLIVRARAVQKAPVSRGQLRASITHRVNEAAFRVSWGTPLMHGVYVETGTRPGYGPNAGSSRAMPPKGSLLRWVMATFGVGQKEGERIEFAVRRKIAEKGTKPRPFLKPALEESQGDITATFRRNLESVVR